MSNYQFGVGIGEGARKGRQVLAVSGPLTSSTAALFLEAVRSTQAKALIVDLSAVPYVDSMGIGALVQANASCRRAGRSIVLAGLNQRVTKVLKITGVEPVFEIFSAVADAEAALG